MFHLIELPEKASGYVNRSTATAPLTRFSVSHVVYLRQLQPLLLAPEHVLPFNSFSEFNKAEGGNIWFALEETGYAD